MATLGIFLILFNILFSNRYNLKWICPRYHKIVCTTYSQYVYFFFFFFYSYFHSFLFIFLKYFFQFYFVSLISILHTNYKKYKHLSVVRRGFVFYKVPNFVNNFHCTRRKWRSLSIVWERLNFSQRKAKKNKLNCIDSLNWKSKVQIANQKSRNRKSRNRKSRNRKSKIENWKSKIENRKSKIENRKSKIENRKSKIENWKLK